MTFSALYVLPALALLILIQSLWMSARGKPSSRSRKRQRKTRHRVLFFRALIVALMLATVVTRVWPLPDLLEIMQGVMITIAIMIPVCVYIVINKLWPQQTTDRVEYEESVNGPVNAPDLRPAHAHPAAEETSTSTRPEKQRQPVKQAVVLPDDSSDDAEIKPEAPLKQSLEDSLEELLGVPQDARPADSVEAPRTNAELPASRTAEGNTATSLHSQASEQESALDQTLSVGEQMETLDDLVDFHDIGDYEQLHPAADPDAPPAYNPLEKAIAVARDAILEEPGIQDHSTENLPAKSRIELSEMVVRLRSDKMKLQKLVIAQKAVIDSEKQAHERTRVVVKDAISVMRHARHGQRIAEKIARRERAERQRLEKDNVKVRRALDNALSTLKVRAERADVEEA